LNKTVWPRLAFEIGTGNRMVKARCATIQKLDTNRSGIGMFSFRMFTVYGRAGVLYFGFM
jgi:hypothetical protein